MKDIFFIAYVLTLAVLRIAKDLAKIFLYTGIFWGAFISFEFIGSGSHFDLGNISIWLSNHWMGLAVILVLLKTIDTNRKASDISRSSKYMEMYIGSSMRYFEIEPQTEEMLKMKNHSFWYVWKKNLTASALSYFIGEKEHSRLLSAKPVRADKQVSFEDDFKRFVDKEN